MKKNVKDKVKRILCCLLSGVLLLSTIPTSDVQATEPDNADIQEYEVFLNGTGRVFVSNDEAVAYDVGDTYYLTYTVAKIGGSVTSSGVGTTTDRTAEYPYQTGGMQFERDASLLTEGYTYTICVETTATGKTYTVTKTDGSSSTNVTLSQPNGTIGKNGTTHFGLVAMGTNITGKLTNVKCYDQDGNNLGVWGNQSRNVMVDAVIDTENVAEYDVYMNATANVFVGNNVEAAFETGEQYYLTYTVADVTSTAGQSGIIVTSDNTKQYPYEAGGMYFSTKSQLLEQGASYRVRVTVLEEKIEYLIIKETSEATSIISFGSANGDLGTKGPFFGIWEVGGTTTGTLTNVKCYDASGTDLGVWGDVEHGVTTKKIVEINVPEYEVTISNSARVFVSNDKAVDFAVGDKYYLTYTVSEIGGSITRNAVATTSDRTNEYPYSTGGMKYEDTGLMFTDECAYTICVEVTASGTVCTVTKLNGTNSTTITLTNNGTFGKTGNTHFGLMAMGTGVTGKLTNVKCYDQDGNDLGVWGNTNYNVFAHEVLTDINVPEYEVTISNSGRVFVCNNDTVDYTVGDKYYLTYTVSDITYTPGWAGIATATDRTAEYPYSTGGVTFNKDNSMLSKGYTYTICAEVTSTGRTYTVTKTNGTDTSTITLNGGSAGTITTAGTTYFGLMAMGSGISGKLTNVKCYDQDGNNLGVWGNTTYNVTATKIVGEINVPEYEVTISNSARVFVSNDTAVDFTVGDKYYLTYTVSGIGGTLTRNAVATTSDRTHEYPYTLGGMKYEDTGLLFTDKCTYTICVEVTATGTVCTVTKTNGTDSTTVALTNNGTFGKTDNTHFGLMAMGSGISGKLTNVKCYDQDGNNLGVWGNTTYGVTTSESIVINTDAVRAYDVYFYDSPRAFMGNKQAVSFESGEQYYLSYTVEDAVSTAGGGIVVATKKSIEYPYTSGGMYLNTNSGILFDEGASYEICVTATDEKMTYKVVKTKDGVQSNLTFSEVTSTDVTTKGLYFGIWLHGGSTIAKLTDVKCYDMEGNDLAVYTNTTYNAYTVRKDTEIGVKDRGVVSYDLEDGAYLIIGHNIKVECIEGATTGNVVVDSANPVLQQPGTYEVIRQEAGGFYKQTVILYKIGDVNLDGTVSNDDLTELTQMVNASNSEVVAETAAQMAADLDNDEKVGTKDVELLTQIMEATVPEDELKAVKKKYHISSLTYDYLGGDNVMPIAAYYGPYSLGDNDYLTDDVFELLQKSGVNMITHSANVCDGGVGTKTLVRKMLELADKYGIGYLIDDTRLNTNVDISNNTLLNGATETTKNEVVSTANIANYLGDYSYYNSFLGTHITDEPFGVYKEGAEYKYLGFYEDIAKKLNGYSNMNGFINLLGSSHTTKNGKDYEAFVEEFIEDCDPQVLSFDVYPFFENAEAADANGVDYNVDNMKTYFESLSVMRMASVNKNLPFWSYVQAGGDYRTESGNDNAETDESLLPTQAETLWNVNTSLAFGAKGIEWFPAVQPSYFSLDSSNTENGGYDYDRNGLIGADANDTPFYAYAQKANAQIAAVDEVLMKATSKGVIATEGYAKTYTEKATMSTVEATEHVTLVDSANDLWGALIGCFDYRDTEAYYIVNFDTTAEQKITLTLDGKYDYRLIQNAISTYATTNEDNQIVLQIPAGEAVLVVLEDRTVSYDITNYRSGETMLAPDAEPGYVFAGWFTDETCVTAISETKKDGNAVAKFVSDELMTTKAQISVKADETTGKRHIRFVSTIDGLKYQAVGLEIAYGNTTCKNELKYVYKTLSATDVQGQKTYVPSDIGGTQAYRFIVDGVKNVPTKYFDLEFHVRPYWVTLDGTTVYGDVVVKTINQGLQ